MNRVDVGLDPYRRIRSTIDLHLREKFANQPWLYSCIHHNNVEDFPYSIADSGIGQVPPDQFFQPNNQSTTEPIPWSISPPRFVVNIPEGRRPGSTSDAKFLEIINKLKTESFGPEDSTLSPSILRPLFPKAMLAVVIGTNQVESLDPSLNQKFATLIEETQTVSEIAVRRFGFLWQAQYKKKSSTSLLYPVKKAFLLLKVLAEKRARQVRESIEERGGKTHPNIIAQIPFQKIREKILKSNFTQSFADFFQSNSKSSPTYLTVMDPDFLSLRQANGYGIFTRMATRIPTSGLTPSVIACGYLANNKELPIIQLAIRIDMAVRNAMMHYIPFSAYLPEPCLSVLLKKRDENHHLEFLSFLGNGRALESRRLISNGKKNGVLDNNVIFIPDGIITTSPERWKTKKNQSYRELSPEELKTKPVLQALRGLSQSHIHPKKWADSVYIAIAFKTSRVTHATQQIMHIFNVFDPISRMFAQSTTRFSSKIFDTVIANYNKPLEDSQTNLLNTARTQLITLNMSRDLIDRIVEAAKASGEAICNQLSTASERPLNVQDESDNLS